MKLGIATIDYLRADVGNGLFAKAFPNFAIYPNHYAHHTATLECFKRFTEKVTAPVHFITDGDRLKNDNVFPASKSFLQSPLDIDTPPDFSPDRLANIGLLTSKLCCDAFEERYLLGNDEVIWVHFFRRTHAIPVLKEYHLRAWQMVEMIKGLIQRCPGNWIVSADHGLDFKLPSPHRKVGEATLHVPLASNCLPQNNEFTHHDMLAEFANGGDFSGAWQTLQCFDSLMPGCPEYKMSKDGVLSRIADVTPEDVESIKARMAELGYA